MHLSFGIPGQQPKTKQLVSVDTTCQYSTEQNIGNYQKFEEFNRKA